MGTDNHLIRLETELLRNRFPFHQTITKKQCEAGCCNFFRHRKIYYLIMEVTEN